MSLGLDLLSDITWFEKYARYMPDKQRREVFDETVDRVESMMIRNVADKDFQTNMKIIDKIKWAYSHVRRKNLLGSQRCSQFAGAAIEQNNARMFNCWYDKVDHPKVFSEFVFILLSGGGVGFSCRRRHVEKLPPLKHPNLLLEPYVYQVQDSIEGWADAVDMLINCYMNGGVEGGRRVVFDWSKIRPEGTPLKTSGGRAPGPKAIALALAQMEGLLMNVPTGTKLRPIHVHDLICMAAGAIKAGGIRRSALISLFDHDDDEMINCKSGRWWADAKWRENANNSACFEDADKEVALAKFKSFWDKAKVTNSGDPGFVKVGLDDGTNPCAEIGLHPGQACNLVEINGSHIKCQQDLDEFAQAAAIVATCQAKFTNFHYLRPHWKETTDREALIGVSITGIVAMPKDLDLDRAANIVQDTNREFAALIGINPSARCTTVKPAGSTSCVLKTASGIHDWHYRYFIRHSKISKSNPFYKFLAEKCPALVVDDVFRPTEEAYIAYPIAIDDHESASNETSPIEFLERVKKYSLEWIKPGLRYGDIENNVSCTVNIRPDEWDEVGQWMVDNWDHFKAISFLPSFEMNEAMLAAYPQPPFKSITKEEYEARSAMLVPIDLREFIEANDETKLQGELACAGGQCEIP